MHDFWVQRVLQCKMGLGNHLQEKHKNERRIHSGAGFKAFVLWKIKTVTFHFLRPVVSHSWYVCLCYLIIGPRSHWRERAFGLAVAFIYWLWSGWRPLGKRKFPRIADLRCSLVAAIQRTGYLPRARKLPWLSAKCSNDRMSLSFVGSSSRNERGTCGKISQDGVGIGRVVCLACWIDIIRVLILRRMIRYRGPVCIKIRSSGLYGCAFFWREWIGFMWFPPKGHNPEKLRTLYWGLTQSPALWTGPYSLPHTVPAAGDASPVRTALTYWELEWEGEQEPYSDPSRRVEVSKAGPGVEA